MHEIFLLTLHNNITGYVQAYSLEKDLAKVYMVADSGGYVVLNHVKIEVSDDIFGQIYQTYMVIGDMWK